MKILFIKKCIITSISLALLMLGLISCHHKNSLLQSLSPNETNVHFENKLEPRKAFGILYYLYYYNGGGVAIGDINNDGLPDIYFTANTNGGNKLYLNKGNFKFEDITAKASVAGTSDWCTGVTMADVNGDGYLDIYVSAVSGEYRLKGHNELFINNKNGTFTESAKQYGLDFSGYTSQVAFFDYDHDGDLDCFLLNQSHSPNANIIDTSNRRIFSAPSGNYLFRNDVKTTGKFTDVSAQAGLYQSKLCYGLGLCVADLNNDGWDDIYVGNDFHENDYYYINNGNGTFTESGAQHFNHYSRFSMGNDVGDYNNDGQPDVVTVDMLPNDEKVLKTYGSDENADVYQLKIINNGYQNQYSRNCLQRNNGNGSSFSDVGLETNIAATDWSWSPLFVDFDNDGNKDLFISSGIVKRPVDMDYIKFLSAPDIRQSRNLSDALDSLSLSKMPDGASHPFLFQGNSQTFKDVSDAWGTGDMKGYFNGAAYADLDNDGNVDVVINCINAPAVILKNNAPKKNHLTLSFKGSDMNTMGIGCKAYLFTKGKLQYQELMLTHGFQSSSEARLHFGLDSLQKVDSLLVVWPNQHYQLLTNVAANGSLVVNQDNAKDSFVFTLFFKPEKELFSQVNDANINWQHHENAFDDFNEQYLIPHKESTRGPRLTVADVNSDGLDDFYACGASGQAGTLMVQNKDGSFTSIDTTLFNKDANCEDVDALFFDANNDGKPDLYVVSGGNQFTGNNPLLLDRLYINGGNGHFTKSTDALPQLFANKSCVTAADVDGDGDIDLFTGTLADATAYGIPQTSYLLLNDGDGHFSVANKNIIRLQNIGMVTSAAFSDVNKDGKPDLIVAGEWMPLTLFINTKKGFEKHEIPHSSGWWQTVYASDVNGDGNVDLLCGNWGWNNKFCSGKDGKVEMYVHDFSGSGKVTQLLAYSLHNEWYPFLAKDEIEKPLPLLKKHYLLYADYAGLPMKDVFYGWIDTLQPLIAEHLGSAVCYGDGKGGFNLHDLPFDLQAAPIFSFEKVDENKFMLGGNFYDVIPYEGRYDAQPLDLFSINKNDSVSAIHQSNLLDVKGQVRDIKWLRTAKGKIVAGGSQ